MSYQVLLTTSGIGNRLGDFTKFTNKSLVSIGAKPAISYIIEQYPKDVEFVVTLGYFGNHIEQFLDIKYPELNFTYVNVDNYSGPGSSLAYSILQAKEKITGPFIFHACDTLVLDEIPEPNHNWLGGFKSENNSQYVSFDINEMIVSRIHDKGQLNSDLTYIGLAGIFHYNEFFDSLQSQYNANPENSQLSDCAAIKILNKAHAFKFKKFDKWLDIGNTDSLKKAKEYFKDDFEILEKPEESIFLFKDDCVIKFFSDTNICINRVIRASHLEPLTPKITAYSNNFYKYDFIPGEILSRVVNDKIFTNLLDWIQSNLWKKQDFNVNFKQLCYDFYYSKTLSRIDKYLNDGLDKEIKINGLLVPPAKELLEQIDMDWLCNSEPYQFHGDMILDNILIKDGKFTLIDWRQDFGGHLHCGDMYYDLGKLNHNLVFNHDIVNKNYFTIEIKEDIECDILRSNILSDCQKILQKFIAKNKLDQKKVNVMSSLIWINMAPLHVYPLDQFLFNFGKYNLFKSLNDIS